MKPLVYIDPGPLQQKPCMLWSFGVPADFDSALIKFGEGRGVWWVLIVKSTKDIRTLGPVSSTKTRAGECCA